MALCFIPLILCSLSSAEVTLASSTTIQLGSNEETPIELTANQKYNFKFQFKKKKLLIDLLIL